MSHATVMVVIKDAANVEEAQDQLDELMNPYDENLPTEPRFEACDQIDVDQAVAHYRDHPENCTQEGEGPTQPYDTFVTDPTRKIIWTREAVGGYHRNDRSDGVYLEATGEFGYHTTWNEEGRWDWWQLGGRWHGYLQVKPGVVVGGEPVPDWRKAMTESLKTAFGANQDGKRNPYADPVEGSEQLPQADGTQDAILGLSGTGGDDPDENFEGRADLARKSDIDFTAMRSMAGQRADLIYDKFEAATKDLPLPMSFDEAVKLAHFDNNLDPDVEPVTDEERLRRKEVVAKAREIYHAQPFIKALSDADLLSFFGPEPVEQFCIYTGGRDTFVAKARLGALSTHAMLVDGEWHENGQMGWFGISSGAKEDWLDAQDRLLAKVPDDAYIAIVDFHV